MKLDKAFPSTLVWTGQHFSKELKDIFFEGLSIKKPDYDLGVTELGEMIDKLIPILRKEKPDYVIVYGDTRSTLAGALACLHENIKLVHIEAGCRSYNDNQIEERIRKVVDEIACIHFAPSQNTADYLSDRGKQYVMNVGAAQIDAMWKTFPTKRPKDAFKYYVCTIHRAETIQAENKLTSIFEALNESGVPIRLYLHPHTEKMIKKYGIKINDTITIKKPIGYKKMINEIAFANKVITDSGGLQVEAFFLRRPCVTLREETEWKETVELNWNRLVGYDKTKILSAINETNVKRTGLNDVYGYGKTNDKIRLTLQGL